MEVKLTEELCQRLGPSVVKQYGLDIERFKWAKFLALDLRDLNVETLRRLLAQVQPHRTVRGTQTLIADLERWLAVLDGTEAKPRKLDQFASLLAELLAPVPGHRLHQWDDDRGVWLCYYVNEIEYVEASDSSGYRHPAYVKVVLVWQELGGRRSRDLHFEAAEAVGVTPRAALLRRNLYVETDELRAWYLAAKARFDTLVGSLGTQLLATGIGTDDLDGNRKARDGWWYRHTNTIRLERDGAPARVVIDVFREDDKETRERTVNLDPWFWARRLTERQRRRRGSTGRTELPAEDEDGAVRDDDIEVPVHLNLACFDLKRHLRLRINVDQVTPYGYDPALGAKLILPAEARRLVDLLLRSDGEFQDIVAGKGGGAVILCAGSPGTGKTLTAEVYAEVMQRPLYSVQASQLGTQPDDLEDELLKVFARAQRWGAILLLDEADVYVAARGQSLEQNAIVGVFLRVLEYYHGVLFMTTNRADLVDDAVASRCVARIDYRPPEPPDQARIWRVLADTAGLELPDAVIKIVVGVFPRLSGRDIKNLLKLAKLVAAADGVPITLPVIQFVKKFKPTTGEA